MPAPQSLELLLTILMPCLDEAETIEACVRNAMDYLARSGIAGEVLIADNGSTDGSQSLAAACGARVVPVSQRGYGAALKGGIDAARGRYIIMGDADDSYDFSQLDEFVKQLAAGKQLVMGNRFQGGIAAGAMPFLHRYIGNPILSFIGRKLFRIPIGDFHCGLRAFHKDAIRELDLVTTGMEFASEMVVRASLAGLAITEVPTRLRPDGRSRAPHLKTWSDGWRHLKFLLLFSPRWLFAVPGVLLSVSGLALALALALGSINFGGMGLGINSFTAACFMVISGVQVLGFGVLARYYAAVAGILPESTSGAWVQQNINTNVAVRIAVLLLVLGLGIFGWAFEYWSSVGFGAVTNRHVPQAVISGLTLVVIAIELGFGAFMIDLLKVPFSRRPQE